MRTSESVKQIAPAIANAHMKITHASKDSQNPHFKNDYASLESVIDATRTALLEQGVVVLQGMSSDKKNLETRLQHTSGEFIETDFEMVLSKQDMQGLGSATTYARRYALAAAMNISQQDDDGNAASSSQKKAPKSKGTGSAKPADAALTGPVKSYSDDF